MGCSVNSLVYLDPAQLDPIWMGLGGGEKKFPFHFFCEDEMKPSWTSSPAN